MNLIKFRAKLRFLVMMENWYCATLGDQSSHNGGDVEEEIVETQHEQIEVGQEDYKSQYQNLKRKLKFLLYVSTDCLKPENLRLRFLLKILNYLIPFRKTNFSRKV